MTVPNNKDFSKTLFETKVFTFSAAQAMSAKDDKHKVNDLHRPILLTKLSQINKPLACL